ncbi:MAG: hypothetical protein IJ867_00030 [Clostridia bacterium]|nr:hypothetical protein [Clostridia bacterium]
MENNNGCEKEYDCIKPRKRCRKCGEYILGILSVSLAVVLGLIFGAVYATTILTALSALIIFAVMLAILIIIRLISIFCKNY